MTDQPRSFRCPGELWHAAMARAREDGIPLTGVLVRALEQYVEGGAGDGDRPVQGAGRRGDAAGDRTGPDRERSGQAPAVRTPLDVRGQHDDAGSVGTPLIDVLTDDPLDDVTIDAMHIHHYDLTGKTRRYRIGTPPDSLEYQRTCTCGDTLWTPWHNLGTPLQKQAQGA